MNKNKLSFNYLSVIIAYISMFYSIFLSMKYNEFYIFIMCGIIMINVGIDFYFDVIIKHLDGEIEQLQKHFHNYDLRRLNK